MAYHFRAANTGLETMGIGQLGRPDLVFKRKFRWTLAFNDIAGKFSIGPSFLKTAARPNLQIDESEINYMNAKMFIPGKAAWQEMEITYLDVATDQLQALWQWICQVYNVFATGDMSIANRTMGSQVRDYSGTGQLTLYDGCGRELEEWSLYRSWPKSIDFGELDYSNSEVCEVKMSLRYNDVGFRSLCPAYNIQPWCSPCSGTTNNTVNSQTFAVV